MCEGLNCALSLSRFILTVWGSKHWSSSYKPAALPQLDKPYLVQCSCDLASLNITFLSLSYNMCFVSLCSITILTATAFFKGLAGGFKCSMSPNVIWEVLLQEVKWKLIGNKEEKYFTQMWKGKNNSTVYDCVLQHTGLISLACTM